MYEIQNWKPIQSNSKAIGSFTLKINDLLINDFTLVEGNNGQFISFPSRQYTDKEGATKYINIVYIADKDRRQKFNDWAVSELAKIVQPEPAQGADEDLGDIPF